MRTLSSIDSRGKSVNLMPPDVRFFGQNARSSDSCRVEHLGEVSEELRPDALVEFDDVVTVSAKRRDNVDELKRQFRRLLDLHADEQRHVDALVDRRWVALQRNSSEHFATHLV